MLTTKPGPNYFRYNTPNPDGSHKTDGQKKVALFTQKEN